MCILPYVVLAALIRSAGQFLGIIEGGIGSERIEKGENSLQEMRWGGKEMKWEHELIEMQ